MGNYCNSCAFCAGDGGTWVGGGSVCVDCGVVSTGGGFQRSYADLGHWIGPMCSPPPSKQDDKYMYSHYFLYQLFIIQNTLKIGDVLSEC